MIGSGLPLPAMSSPVPASTPQPGAEATATAASGTARSRDSAQSADAAEESSFDRMLGSSGAESAAAPATTPEATPRAETDASPAESSANATSPPLADQMLSLLASLAPPAPAPAAPGPVAVAPDAMMPAPALPTPQPATAMQPPPTGVPASLLTSAAMPAAAAAQATEAAPAFALAALAPEREREALTSLDGTTPEVPLPTAASGVVGPSGLSIRETMSVAVAPQSVVMPADPEAGLDDAFGANLMWMADQKLGQAEIRVTPDHLGPIDVRVQLDGSRVRAEFLSAQPEVRQAIEASVTRLRDMLGQHGLQLSQADVGHRQSRSSDGSPSPFGRAPADSDEPVVTPATVRMRRGLLDTYA